MRKPNHPWLDIDGLDVLTTFAMFLLIPGFGGAWEEPGWRGYAVPRLQSGRTALRAAVILGVLIAVWHLPLILVGQVSWTDMIQIMGAVIIFNWLFNNARGSVLIIMLAHAVNNTVWSTLTSKVVAEPDFGRQAVLQAVVWCVTAVIVVLVAGPANLSRRHVKSRRSHPACRSGASSKCRSEPAELDVHPLNQRLERTDEHPRSGTGRCRGCRSHRTHSRVHPPPGRH